MKQSDGAAERALATGSAAEINNHAGLVFSLIAISVLLGIAVHFYMELQQFLLPLMALPLVFGYAGIAAYAMFFTDKRRERRLMVIWFFAGVYLIAAGLLRWNMFSDARYMSVFINQDLRYFMYAGCGIILSNPVFRARLLRLLRFAGVLSVIFGVLSLTDMNLDMAMLRNRLQVWSLPYYFWWLSVSCYALCYAVARMTGKNKLSGLGALLAYSVCGVLFLKKAVIVNTVLLLVICELLFSGSSGRRGALKRIAAAAACVALIAVVIWLLTESVPLISNLVRSFQTRLALAETANDRFYEVTLYFSRADWSDIVFGKGYGNYVTLPTMYGTGEYLVNALHIGYMDILYVGGIPYCILWLGIVAGVLRHIREVGLLEPYERACLAASALLLCSLMFELSRGMLVGAFFQYTALGTVLCLRPSRERNGDANEDLLQRETGL